MSEIHSTAVIQEGAQIGEGCRIGPYCVIGPNVTLGTGCELHSHVVIDGHTEIDSENAFYPFASIGLRTQDLKWNGGTTWTRIGSNNTFREYVTVHSASGDGDATVIGSHNNLLAYTHVAHDCQLGDHIIMSNVGTLAGHVTVEDRAIVGGLAAVHQFCRIGTMSIIGGCSKVVQDVPPYMMVDGNPAATRTLNKEGFKRNGVSEDTQRSMRQAYRILFRSEQTFTNAVKQVRADVASSSELEHLLAFIESSERGIAK
ncbi:MAG TPA: acyl-[acyl-carrier-protein]--UDP-N-acetylglucosamine O-acyltransferase [Verrucomicrobiales bacterium]|nr:acyl-[acyl-carrier-protein]--UDP-N-acetylglucosamine O-acyltransferase [Verrucomicrobiales bacterium]|tara:strand:+ start:737 stop:1510 length:774 start_codon:yes stop_codon:yes gene_type:complete